MKVEKHLCIVIDRHTKATIKEMGEIEAVDWYHARHMAARKFEQENPDLAKQHGNDWAVDSCPV